MPGPTPGKQLHDTEAGHPVTRILDEAQQRQQVLDVRGVEELQPAELHEGDVAACQLDFERAAVVRGAKQNRLLFEGGALLAVAPVPARRHSAPGQPRRAP